jgi:hypothetical protein
MKSRNLTGLAVATAVIALLSAGPVFAGEGHTKAAKDKTVKCTGINSCKGKGACGAADGSHDCAGKNSCKGKGWVKVKSEKECKDKGGEVLKAKKDMKKKEEKKG